MGGGVLAEINNPQGIAIDKFNNLYFADILNNRVRKINAAGIITTVAGKGVAGYSGDEGQATDAKLNEPGSVAIDNSLNIYISDNNNVIRKINTSGIITTIAGTGTTGYSGDGGMASVAELNVIWSINFDGTGNLYVSDAGNYRIRKINTAGIITTIAGTGIAGYTGDGGQAINAKLNSPWGIICDNTNNLYFSDEWNNVVRKIDSSGIITTIAGMGIAGYSGDNGNSLSAELYSPGDLGMDKQGNLYIGDDGNNRIRKVTNVGQMAGIARVAANKAQVMVYPNPATNILNIDYTIDSEATFVLYDVNGRVVLKQTLNTSQNHVELNNIDLPNGLYMYNINNTDGQNLQKGKVTILK